METFFGLLGFSVIVIGIYSVAKGGKAGCIVPIVLFILLGSLMNQYEESKKRREEVNPTPISSETQAIPTPTPQQVSTPTLAENLSIERYHQFQEKAKKFLTLPAEEVASKSPDVVLKECGALLEEGIQLEQSVKTLMSKLTEAITKHGGTIEKLAATLNNTTDQKIKDTTQILIKQRQEEKDHLTTELRQWESLTSDLSNTNKQLKEYKQILEINAR